MSLNSHELDQYYSEGYVIKEDVYSLQELEPIKAAIAELVDEKAAALNQEGELATEDLFADEPVETRLARIYEADQDAGPKIVRHIQGGGGGGYSGPAMFEMYTHPPLLSCIESIVGPDIIGSSVYRIRPKLPNWERGEVPWHQDSGYLLAHCDRNLIVTCWVPLVDSSLHNGCLYVMPRAHRQGIFEHFTGGHGGYLEIPGKELPNKPIPMEMKAGGVLFMTNMTPHSSFENKSDGVRWSVDLRYQDSRAPNNVDDPPDSVTREREPVTMACYPPEADFVIRDTQQRNREVRDPETFHELRKRYEVARPRHPGRGWTPLSKQIIK